MATYAIGDLQGCYSELEQLLTKIDFDRQNDQVWFVGDLVNRGPQSIETVQYIRSLGDAAKCVLGNHDIHLIACYCGLQKCKPNSSLNAILQHQHATQIIDWLRQQPLLYIDANIDWLMVHAGLLPQWSLPIAQRCAHEVEQQLRSDQYADFLQHAYGNHPNQWHPDLNNRDRWRLILNAFTRLRLCDQQGQMDFEFKGPLDAKPEHLHAWFDVPRQADTAKIIFGHWSALGLVKRDNLLALDTGCLWGNQLTAARIDIDPVKIYQIECTAKQKIS